MSLEHHPVRSGVAAVSSGDADEEPPGPADDLDYWNSLIDEHAAGAFAGLAHRTMQLMRQRGDGPRFVRLSARCIRYRRIDLKAWAEARMRSSTADPGPEDNG